MSDIHVLFFSDSINQNELAEYNISLQKVHFECKSCQEAAESTLQDLISHWNNHDWVVVGHYWMTWVLYEYLILLRERGLRTPIKVIISHFPSPTLPVANMPWSGNLSKWHLPVCITDYALKYKLRLDNVECALLWRDNAMGLRQDMMDKWQEVFPNIIDKRIEHDSEESLSCPLKSSIYRVYLSNKIVLCGWIWR